MPSESGKLLRNRPTGRASAFLTVPVLSGVMGASVTFALIRGISLEAVASVLVAAGTFVLAYFTWQSVTRTNDVIAAEDRRHQQGLAPLLVIEASATQRTVGSGAETGIRVTNIGYGLALNIVVTLQGTFWHDTFSTHEDTEENKLRFAGKFDPQGRSVIDGKNYLNVTERESEPFDRHVSISAVEAGGGYFQHEPDFLDRVYSRPVALYRVGLAKYEDMFGNPYVTQYLDEELDHYDWHQPQHLRIPNPESR